MERRKKLNGKKRAGTMGPGDRGALHPLGHDIPLAASQKPGHASSAVMVSTSPEALVSITQGGNRNW